MQYYIRLAIQLFFTVALCFAVKVLYGQTYTHPTTGINNTTTGICTVNGCSGTYFDDGGVAGNYSHNINGIYRTFCPDTALHCVRLVFSSFNLEPVDGSGLCNDFLQIRNGPSENGPIIWQGCGSTVPPTITSTHSSGCLTIGFTSNSTLNAAGWAATISCAPCPGGSGTGPRATLNTDCINAQLVCDNLHTIEANSQGPGLVSEICNSGCIVAESYSNWFIVNITQAGSFDFTLNPTPLTANFDFALFGPVTGGCENLGAPIRCSQANTTGQTGMISTALDTSEDVTGDGWVSSVNVTVGKYYLLINQREYEPNSEFQLDFNLNGGTSTIGLPAPTISSNSPVCANAPIQFTTDTVPGANYFWSGPFGWTANTVGPRRAPPEAGTYTYYYNINGCNSATDMVNVSLVPSPVPVSEPSALTICEGKDTLLTTTTFDGTPPYTYAWSGGGAGPDTTIAPIVSDWYWVTATDANGCTAASFSVITVDPAPMASVTPDSVVICPGASATLTATGGVAYSWDNGPAIATNTVNPTITTVYTVTVTGANSCTSTASAIVDVGSSTVASIVTSSNAICIGGSATLTAHPPGAGYLWSTNETTQNITVNPASTTSYMLTVTDANSCTSTATAVITVVTAFTAVINVPSFSICPGESIVLTADPPGVNYLWSTNDTTETITVSPTTDTQYLLTVTDGSSCTSTAMATITVNAPPVAAINPDASAICEGENANLTASPAGANYLWSTNDTTSTITVSPTSDTQYGLTVTDASSCTSSASATVTVTPATAASINPLSASICLGESISLTGSPSGESYLWTTGDTTQTITVSPTMTTQYTLTVTQTNSCVSTATALVVIDTLSSANINPDSVSICDGESATLTASPTGATYLWSNNDTTESININPIVTTSFSVTVTDTNSCISTASAIVSVNPPPVAAISLTLDSICLGGGTTLTAFPPGVSYLWSTNETTEIISVSPIITTTYGLTVTDSNNCTSIASQTVTIIPNITVFISPEIITICQGDSITLTASGGTNYSWNTSASSPAITVKPNSTTVYSVTATDGGACSATDSRTVKVSPSPSINASANPASLMQGQPTILTATGGDSYLWSSGHTTASFIDTPMVTTTYNVTAIDANSCSGTAKVTVNVLPTGINEIAHGSYITIYPNPTSSQVSIVFPAEQPSIVLDIYTITGKKIFSTTSISSNKFLLETSHLPPGVYLLRIGNNENFVTKKLVVTK